MHVEFRNAALTGWTIVSAANPLPVSASLDLAASDIEIGAVEIKNDATDDRAKVQTAAPTGSTMGLVTWAQAVGAAAHDAVAAGNPLLVAAYASAAAPVDVSADADAVRLWALRNGSLVVNLAGGGTLIQAAAGTAANAMRVALATDANVVDTELPAAAALADAAANPTTPLAGACDHEFNGTTWDRRRGNTEATVFTSAARTTTTNSADLTNYSARGVRLTLDITAASGVVPTLDVKIQAKDTLSGAYVDIAGAVFTQKTATGTDELVIYPGIAETANESVSDIIPRAWRAVATIAGTTPSFTFSLGAAYVL